MKNHPLRLILAFAALLLAACAPFAPQQPTPVAEQPPVATAAPQPTLSAATGTPRAPTASPVPPSPVPATATALAPTTTPAPRNPQTRLGTFFFYWYDCPRNECDASQLSVLPPGWETPLPHDRDERDGRSYSSRNGDWYEGELRDMRSVGIDTLFPVSWGDHPHPWFTNEVVRLLVQANGVQPEPLRIGMFLDTTAQQAMYNDMQDRGYRYGPDAPRLPLADPMSGYFFYDRHIKGFFEQIPPAMWATEGGRPIIIAYTSLCCADMQRAGAMWAAVKAAFERDFGVAPWLVLEDTWFAPEALDPPAGMRRIEEVADGRYSWGAALRGPQTRTLHGYSISSVGPGFDNRKIVGVAQPAYQPRTVAPGGQPGPPDAFFQASLAAVPQDADLLLIETWNEWPESTGIARANYLDDQGRPLPEDLYLQTLRRWRFGP